MKEPVTTISAGAPPDASGVTFCVCCPHAGNANPTKSAALDVLRNASFMTAPYSVF
jgi:hypothetical protein